jgi:signal transduction histidine kinase
MGLATAVLACLAALPWFLSFGPVNGDKGGILAAALVTLCPGCIFLAASRNPLLESRLRQALGLFGITMLLTSAGNFLRLLDACGVALPSIPGISEYSNLVLWAIGFVALVRLPLRPVVPGTLWRMCTDVAVAGVGMALAIYVVWTLPGLHNGPAALRREVMMFNGMAAGNLFVFNLILVRGTAGPLRTAVRWLSATVIIETVYLVAFQYVIGTRSHDARLIDSLFFIDYLAYLYAGAHFLNDTRTGAHVAGEKPNAWVVNPLPICAVIGIGALLIVSALQESSEAIVPLSIGIVVMALLLLARVIISNFESLRVVEEKAERERRLQAEKHELIRRLSGGIAQIINNMMTVVHGHAELLREDFPEDSLTRGSLDAISSSAYRVSALAGRLELASGQRRKDERPTRLVEAVLLQRDTVNRMVGQKREVVWDLSGADGNALVAKSDMETIMRELVSNAGEATFHGGTITIRIREEMVSKPPRGISPCPPQGVYSILEIADTGRGIPESDIPFVVEPFFTSRPLPEGRGLGLSIVHGIVASYGGGLHIDAVPGSGSRISVYLPTAEAA